MWVRLPEPLDAAEMAARAEREGVSFLPGRYFAVSRPQTQWLRLSFAGLDAGGHPRRTGRAGPDFPRRDWNAIKMDGNKRSDETHVLV